MRHSFGKIAFATITFIVTTFILLNTYEVVFNKDVAFANSIAKVTAQYPINKAINDFASRSLSDEINASTGLDNMEYMEISALSTRLRIEESRKIDNQWYGRPGVAHYIELNKNKRGAPIDYLLYSSQSWRTINEPNRIEKGMTVSIHYKGNAESLFTVTDKKVLSIDQSLLVSKSEARQILLIIENPKEGTYYGYSLELRK